MNKVVASPEKVAGDESETVRTVDAGRTWIGRTVEVL